MPSLRVEKSSALDEAAELTRSASDYDPMHDQVYRVLREALVTGRIMPGKGVTLRGLAASLNVSLMPVRDAVRRLTAEGGLVAGGNRRLYVPPMTRQRFDELVAARSVLEPEIAARALPHLTKEHVQRLKRLDDSIESSLQSGDVEAYMTGNFRFHFEIYRASSSVVLMPLVESLWQQFGPFMRSVYGRVGTAHLVDQHERAIEAIIHQDEPALRLAIQTDILDGMKLIGVSVLAGGPLEGEALA